MPSSKPAVGHADEAPRQADQQEEASQLRVVILSLIRSEKAVVHDQLQHLYIANHAPNPVHVIAQQRGQCGSGTAQGGGGSRCPRTRETLTTTRSTLSQNEPGPTKKARRKT